MLDVSRPTIQHPHFCLFTMWKDLVIGAIFIGREGYTFYPHSPISIFIVNGVEKTWVH